MVKIRLKHVHGFVDRHGKRRYYVRVPGKKAVPLPGEPGSPAFMAEYHAAIDNGIEAPVRIRTGSVSAAITAYLNSGDFLHLAPATRGDQRRVLENLAKSNRGAFPFAQMESQDVEVLLAEKKATPHAAKSLLKALRAVAKVAVKLALIPEDPTAGIKVFAPISSTGFRMWEEDEIAQFEEHWPIGTRERLAFTLLLYTDQRRGDMLRMGRQHVKNGRITVRQSKTGTLVNIPILAPLKAVLAASKTGELTFLTTPSGEPFTPGAFTNWFGKAVRAAGLPLGLSAHGLRKAMCRRLAEAGCTVHEIQAISGHVSLKEIERYTKGVEQERLANAAMARICKPIGPNLQPGAQVTENKEDEIADVSLVWTSTSRTSPSASTARHR